MASFYPNTEHRIRFILGNQDNLGTLPRSATLPNPNVPPQIFNFRNQPVDWHLTVRKISIASPLEKYNPTLSTLTPEFWKEWNDLIAILVCCPQLTEIRLSLLPLVEIPSNLIALSQITKLTIAGENFHGWPSGLERMTQLQELTFYRSALHEIPPEIGFLKNLTSITFLANLPLTNIAPEIGQLSKLEHLAIETAVSLPSTTVQLSCLKSLKVSSHKPIPTLFSFDIGTLTALEVLYLDHCCPAELPLGICDLKALRVLHIDHSPLLTFPDAIGNLQSLEKLTLIDTNLIALPEALCSLSKLSTLELRHNRLEFLPDAIGELPLQFLILRRNRIISFPESLGDLPFPHPQRINSTTIAKGCTFIEEEYVRSLHGLPPALIANFFGLPIDCYHDSFSPLIAHLSPDFLCRIYEPFKKDTSDTTWEMFVEQTLVYYAKSVVELANQAIIDSKSLLVQEWGRLAHEGSYRERTILETVLPPDHPVLQQITTRLQIPLPEKNGTTFHLEL
jgi:hypothetical protein